MKKITFDIKYFLWEFSFLKILDSPFTPFKPLIYMGKTRIGVPYFLPRKWVKSKDKPGYRVAVPLKIGFNFCGLGYKTKWDETDYRFEYAPVFSFVFLGYQIAVRIMHPYSNEYWTAWLYYRNHTDKNKSRRERISQCIEKFSLKYTRYEKETKVEIDYYPLILKKKYRDLCTEIV